VLHAAQLLERYLPPLTPPEYALPEQA